MKFTIDLSGLKIDATKLNDKGIGQIMQEELLNVRARILQDTVAGRTAEGGSLKPYARSTIEAIDSGYVQGKAPGEHTPNLTRTGTLLRSLSIEPGQAPGEVNLFFQGTHPKPHPVSDRHAQKKRRKAEKRGQALQHKGNRPEGSSATRAAPSLGKRLGNKIRKAIGGRKGGGGGGDTQNAVIAQGQYDMGRTGWFTFSKKDVDRIVKRIADKLGETMKNVIQTDSGGSSTTFSRAPRKK